MIKHLADGYVHIRPYSYIDSWLNEKTNKDAEKYLYDRFKKREIEELTHSEFWALFHTACNDEMQDKF